MSRYIKNVFTLCLVTMICTTGIQAYPVVHSALGDSLVIPGKLTLRLITKHQNYEGGNAATRDTDIDSPKSVNFTPDGRKYYVNSLEGCCTVVFDAATHKKLKVISHKFDGTETQLWGEKSKFFPFRHYFENVNCFLGKPVEGTFSHGGRYFWVPYYRRTFDINAQDPSALCVIDTEKDEIVRLMETGPLPKMVTTSHDGRRLAVTHWGDNTVGIINIEGNDPFAWRYESCPAITKKLILNYSLTNQIDRDSDSGLKLRGTVFLPGDSLLLVSRMCGAGGFGVVDVKHGKYLGMLTGMLENTRHMIVSGDYLYLSCNIDGYVQRIRIADLLKGIRQLRSPDCKKSSELGRTASVQGFTTCKVNPGARTICISPDGRWIFAACNSSSSLVIVDAQQMKVVGSIKADSFPVGLDISPDGRWLITTSQGRSNGGGNAVDVFEITTIQPDFSFLPALLQYIPDILIAPSCSIPLCANLVGLIDDAGLTLIA